MLTDLVAALVAIDSVNPALVAGAAGEGEIAGSIAGWARDAGLEVERLERTPGRPSVVARARGTGGGRTLLLCGHTDTVTTAGMTHPPLDPRVDGDRLYGRGSYDMKAGLAAALIAAREAVELDLRGDVAVAAVADEEHASLGVQEVLERVRADAAVVTEPTELELVIAHKGFAWAEITVAGRAAHGSRPHLGVDAIVKTGPILTALCALDQALAERTHPLLGRPSVHASLISGGEELSSYPASCTVSVERRTLPGETAADVEREIEALVDGDAAHELTLVREPFAIAADHPLVTAVRGAAGRAIGEEPPLTGASYWADSAFIAAAGIPTVLFGPGGAGAHAAEEWVSLSDTAAVARTLTELARDFCA